MFAFYRLHFKPRNKSNVKEKLNGHTWVTKVCWTICGAVKMCRTKDGFLDAVRSSVPLILLYILDGIPMTREPSVNKVELLIWGRRNKLSTLGSLNTANIKGRGQIPSSSLMTAGSGWWRWLDPDSSRPPLWECWRLSAIVRDLSSWAVLYSDRCTCCQGQQWQWHQRYRPSYSPKLLRPRKKRKEA